MRPNVMDMLSSLASHLYHQSVHNLQKLFRLRMNGDSLPFSPLFQADSHTLPLPEGMSSFWQTFVVFFA